MKVPQLGVRPPQDVQTQAFQGTQQIATNKGMFGGDDQSLEMGSKLLTAVADTGHKAFMRAQADSDETELLEIEAEYDKWRDGYLNDKTTGMFMRKGKDSQNAATDTQAQFDAKAEALQKQYKDNPRITNSLTKYLQAQRRKIVDEAVSHETQQMKTHRDALYVAKIERTVTTGVSEIENFYKYDGKGGPNDQESAKKAARMSQQAIKEGHNTIRKNAQRLGQSAEEIKQSINKYNDRMVDGVVANLLAKGSDRQASEFYEEHKELVTDVKVRARIVKSLEEESIRGESQRQSDGIMNNAGLDTNEKKQDEARKIKDPKVRDATIKRVNSRIAENKRNNDLEDVDRFNDASKWLGVRNPAAGEDGHNPNQPPGAARDFDDLPANLRPRNARLLTALRSQKPDFDHDAYDAVLDMRKAYANGAQNDWTGEKGAEAVKLLRGKIDDATWKVLNQAQRKDGTATKAGQNLQERVRIGQESAAQTLGTKRAKQLVNTMVPITSRARKKRTLETAKQKDARAKVVADTQQQLAAWYADPANVGKTLSQNQIDNMIYESLVEGEFVQVTPGTIWGTNRNAEKMRYVQFKSDSMGRGRFEVSEDGYDEMARLLSVPEATIKSYVEQIKVAKRPPTIEMIRAAHFAATGIRP